ncbi:MAG: mechanosensitive ion channel, partial [bacterium]|nr:mechanosensitive ion channel [bacterium]
KLWDWRRLIVPTSHFLEKPFQNWSREESNNLIGTVYLYVDYTLPIDILRAELKKILSNSSLWDGMVNVIQVSDLQEKVMQLRVLASADSPSKAWDLRCEVREKLIAFIIEHYAGCLPLSRSKAFNEV